jgi:hypothetical protein
VFPFANSQLLLAATLRAASPGNVACCALAPDRYATLLFAGVVLSVAVPTPPPVPIGAAVLTKSLLVMMFVVEISVVVDGQSVPADVTLTAAKASNALNRETAMMQFEIKVVIRISHANQIAAWPVSLVRKRTTLASLGT